jgi:hypothetical protein
VRDYERDIHPIGFVQDLVVDFSNIELLSFSKYFYRPQWLFDERHCLELSVCDLTTEWLCAQTQSLQEGWELALNSVVKDVRGRASHIGMIDFIGKPSVDLIFDRVRALMGRNAANKMRLYDSGRSLHGYIPELTGPAQWQKFLGRLLLMNSVDEAPIIDARWVGHRIIGGYSALRWSANSPFHAKPPRFLNHRI